MSDQVFRQGHCVLSETVTVDISNDKRLRNFFIAECFRLDIVPFFGATAITDEGYIASYASSESEKIREILAGYYEDPFEEPSGE